MLYLREGDRSIMLSQVVIGLDALFFCMKLGAGDDVVFF